MQSRLSALRNEMRVRTSLQGPEIEAYIVSSFDEHQSDKTDESERRLEFISGFTGLNGDAVITEKSVALWTDSQYLTKADKELDCEWKLFQIGEDPSIAQWLASQIPSDSIVGADPKLIPHYLWMEWDRELGREFLRFNHVNRNLIDMIWGKARPMSHGHHIQVHPTIYSGEKWENKVTTLREKLHEHRCDAIVLTSLTEIAYLLNLRGKDIPFVPVFKSYMIVTHREIILYTNQTKVGVGVNLFLKTENCFSEKCVQIKKYHDIWRDLRTLSQQWKRVLLPSYSVFDMGASEAVFTSVRREIILERVSPIVYMRAKKNPTEREGMRRAHIKDAVAMCDTLSYLEERYMAGDQWTESLLALEVDRSRREQNLNKGLAFKTVVAFGKNAALSHYYPSNASNAEITNENVLMIDSGGQYLDGTTDVARTIHMGEPTADQRRAYTNVLTGIIRLSMLVFPDNLKPAEVDTLIRGPLWSAKQDYPHLTGHGIGSYLGVDESPINIAYTTKYKYTFKDGYFFSIAPGYFKPHDFGIRLKNVLEVIDTNVKHPSGSQFLAFRDTTLVPFEAKLIDKTLLSVQEKKWLNEYNARIREHVGDELKKQLKMQAFYWMMNKTAHITEFLPESEYNCIVTLIHDSDLILYSCKFCLVLNMFCLT
ncbi:unnamed protein product [Diamesa hyperborea]